MRLALIAIGRRENRYALEFVEHYLALGFDHIFIADNNHDGEEHFEDVLGRYISDGSVSIHDYRGRETVQVAAYTELYALYGSRYDWVAFFDFDEFLVMADGTLSGMLSAAGSKGADAVLVNWMCMTDSGLIHDDGRPCMERFTEPVPYDLPVQYDFPDNDHVKSIIRGGIEDLRFRRNPHVPDNGLRCVTADGENCDCSPFHPYSFRTAYLKHFLTKTVEEWMTNKWQKGAGACSMENFLKRYKDRFFKYNEHTVEKQHYMDAFNRNREQRVTAVIVNYNTTRLTQCCVRSLQKHSPGIGVIVFDNSDREPLPPMDGVEILDNTRGQIIDFRQFLQKYPDRISTANDWASAKHCWTVQWLINKRRNPFILMDSDVLVKRDVGELWDTGQAFVGEIKPHYTTYRITIDRVLPFLCFINVKMMKRHGVTYFNFPRMYALTRRRPDCAYDTGCWFLEDVRRRGLPFRVVPVAPYIIHLGHASWKDMSPDRWLEEHREYWE